MLYLQRAGTYALISGTPAPDTGLHRKEQAAPIDSVQELRLLRGGTHCLRCQCTFCPPLSGCFGSNSMTNVTRVYCMSYKCPKIVTDILI